MNQQKLLRILQTEKLNFEDILRSSPFMYLNNEPIQIIKDISEAIALAEKPTLTMPEMNNIAQNLEDKGVLIADLYYASTRFRK